MKERFENPISVSEYISFLNEILKKVRVKVIGEVSQLKVHSPSGHLYFTLKDKKGVGIINCVIWKSVYAMFGISLKEGMEVILSGQSDIYAPRGSLTFKVQSFELVGEGALKKAYNELKMKLEKEGIFDLKRKRLLPEYPQKIGVITSLRSGTVIHDFTSNLGKFGFKIKAMDSRVEGQEAVRDLISSVKLFKKEEIDLLVIIRGGGSLESLMAFDNEMLVREIIQFPVPVIAGIGHHKDITLVSLAADVAESTPSAVAYLLNKSWEKASHKIKIEKQNLLYKFQLIIQLSRSRFDTSLLTITKLFSQLFDEYKKAEGSIIIAITKMKHQAIMTEKIIMERCSFLSKIFQSIFREIDNKISEYEKIISQNNPQRQLRLGYSIIRLKGGVIRSIFSIKKSDILDIEVFDGIVKSEVKKIDKKNEQK